MKYFTRLLIFSICVLQGVTALSQFGELYKALKDRTGFIYVKNHRDSIVPAGTCFFVSINDKEDSTVVFPYLITAKHVLQKPDHSYYPSFYLRLNTKDSSSGMIYINLSAARTQGAVYTHSDSSVDLIAMNFIPPKDYYDFKYLDESLVLSRREFNSKPISEGDEVFFTGLFTPFTGEFKIQPIVRFGKIALIPREKIDWIGRKREMILVESFSFGGNSGSPVYFVYTNSKGVKELVLGGVLSGTYRDGAEIGIIETSGTKIPVALMNNGISGITPAYQLYEILHGEIASKNRKLQK